MNVEYLTECYIKAYEKALEMTDDTNTANTAATMVLTTIANMIRVQTETTSNSLANLLNSIALNNKKQATKSAKRGNEKKEGAE